MLAVAQPVDLLGQQSVTVRLKAGNQTYPLNKTVNVLAAIRVNQAETAEAILQVLMPERPIRRDSGALLAQQGRPACFIRNIGRIKCADAAVRQIQARA